MPSSDTYAKWLAIFRIYTGAFWLLHAIPKFTDSASFLPPSGFMPMMIQKSLGSTTGFYHDFLANVVMPNIAVFAQLVRVGELLVGISLVLGLFSRLGGLGGMFLAANYMLAKNAFGAADGYGSLDFVAIVISFFNLVLPTDARWSLDAVLFRRRRRAVAA
ncbi:MAG: DoxX family membrane protein [Candidatus Eremiobacteraeota bacterium]|nr:DoxX family membrane protein [Candidatus Eremiobacteraeota bacterium]